MKQSTNMYDSLPNVLNATQLANTLGISRAGAYNLMGEPGFPHPANRQPQAGIQTAPCRVD